MMRVQKSFPQNNNYQIKSNLNLLLRDEGFCLSNKMTKIADLPALINVDGAGRRMALRSFGSRHVGLFV